jgi:hypothetical protein
VKIIKTDGFTVTVIKAISRKMITSLPNGPALIQLSDGLKRFKSEVESLLIGKYPVPISEKDQAFGKRLITIASAYGFCYYGPLTGGSFHFKLMSKDNEYVIRIYPDPWPEGVVMSFEVLNSENVMVFYTQKKGKRTMPYGREVTPSNEVQNRFLDFLEMSLEHVNTGSIAIDNQEIISTK